MLSSREWILAEKDDLQAMLFDAWLKAKFESKSYYEVVLGVVRIDM